MDPSVLVALIASGGVLGSAAVQAVMTTRANARADAARADEREQDRIRRQEEREHDARIRAEDRAHELERARLDNEAGAEARREAAAHERGATRRAVAAEFVAAAQRCLVILRLAHAQYRDISGHVPSGHWNDLAAALAAALTELDDVAGEDAQAAVDALRKAATNDGSAAQLDLAQASLDSFVDATRQS